MILAGSPPHLHVAVFHQPPETLKSVWASPEGVSGRLGSLSTQAPLTGPCMGVPSGYRHPSRSNSLPSHVSDALFQSYPLGL